MVDCCSDLQKLRAIRQRVQNQISGLDDSAVKLRCRIRVLDRLLSRFRKQDMETGCFVPTKTRR